MGVTLVSVSTNAFAGSPVASVRNTPFAHGSVSAVSVLEPPELGQPGANVAAVALHDEAIVARLPDTVAPTRVNSPPATSVSPIAKQRTIVPYTASDCQAPLRNTAAQVNRFPTRNSPPPIAVSPPGKVASARTQRSGPTRPSGSHKPVVPFQRAT